jgi:hypothetical protein
MIRLIIIFGALGYWIGRFVIRNEIKNIPAKKGRIKDVL